MINRIQLIQNIGQFDSVSAGADLPLARLTLVYSENGRGKTTLAAVLRSLATGDPIPITERKRLAAQHPPDVVLECAGDPPEAIFKDNTWSRTLPGLVVFDDVFIDRNVHSGLAVEPRHRQELHDLILGAEAVALSRELDDLVDEVEGHNRELRVKEGAIPEAVRGPYSVAEFCDLPPRPDIDGAIQDAERALAASQDQDAVLTTLAFDTLTLPPLDLTPLARLLQRDLPALDSTTLEQVQVHLAALGEGGEGWVGDGVRRIAASHGEHGRDECPFCGQDMRGSPLIDHYRAYFSDAYKALKQEVEDRLAAIRLEHAGDAPANFERAVRVTGERRQFWSSFCEVPDAALDTALIVRDWAAARQAVVEQLEAKQAAPLEAMEFSEEVRSRVAAFAAHQGTIISVSERLQEANRAIEVVKEQAKSADTGALAEDLAKLRATKARHEPHVAALCAEYSKEREAKTKAERQRDAARGALEEHRAKVFAECQATINHYLEQFNAGFRLDRLTYQNIRQGSTCTYNVLINSTPVHVTRADMDVGEPSFRSTLSAGDRNTLALAFFLTSLDQDEALKDKVVVIDDPLSSMDEHRTMTTVQQIRRLSTRAAQVILLSHKKPFLCQVWEKADRDARTALALVRGQEGSTLCAWDVSQDSITEHDHRDARLREFLAGGSVDLRQIAQSIRPHLEAYLRVACPKWFKPGTQFSHFRHLCLQRQGGQEQILAPSVVQELDEMVEYANNFHHDTNPAWQAEEISSEELRGFAKRTLEFCRP